jgi:hypothetical protein
MKKPYILALDDDLSVLRAIERDLKAKFASSYRNPRRRLAREGAEYCPPVERSW